ncbi:MAG: OST-HTH/LOTUS domain-containing protein, partial [Pseudomonadota bacterium]
HTRLDEPPASERVVSFTQIAYACGERGELGMIDIKADEEGFVNISQVGQIAGNRSSFDTRNYGFKSLSDLFASLDNFKMKRDGKQVLVRRLR